MKTKLPPFVIALLGFSLLSAFGQPGPGGGMGGPKALSFGGSLSKLLGETTAFSSALEMQTKGPSGEKMNIPGKMSFNEGKSRMEMDMSKSLPPEMLEQVKAMGMDAMIIINRPDKKISYMAFPSLHAYFEMEIPDTETAEATGKFKVESTELGKETVDGHPCTKNKFILTDDKGDKHESTVWKATDLKQFPIKLETNEQGQPMTILFKEIKFAKPDEALFTPPSGFQRYDNYMTLMQKEVMKRIPGAGLTPPPPR